MELDRATKKWVDNLIVKMKTFKTTIEKPFPSAISSNFDILKFHFRGLCSDLISPSWCNFYLAADWAAVLAGTKPAALVDELFMGAPSARYMKSLTNSKGFCVSKGFSMNQADYVIGIEKNVNAIMSVAPEYYRGNCSSKRRGELDKIIGLNLGYSQEAVESFVKICGRV